MSNSNNFRVTLHLNHFYNDHRSVSRIFVSNDMKTIEDMKCRVSEIFGINNFNLLCENHFLPDAEDVRLLQKDDVIIVLPCNTAPSENKNCISGDVEEINVRHLKEKKRKRKRSEIVEVPVQVIEDDCVLKKRKKKKRKENPELVVQEESCNEEKGNRVSKTSSKRISDVLTNIEGEHVQISYNNASGLSKNSRNSLSNKISYFETLNTGTVYTEAQIGPQQVKDGIKEKLFKVSLSDVKLSCDDQNISKVDKMYSSTPNLTNTPSRIIKPQKIPCKPSFTLERRYNIVKNIVTNHNVKTSTPNERQEEPYFNDTSESNRKSISNTEIGKSYNGTDPPKVTEIYPELSKVKDSTTENVSKAESVILINSTVVTPSQTVPNGPGSISVPAQTSNNVTATVAGGTPSTSQSVIEILDSQSFSTVVDDTESPQSVESGTEFVMMRKKRKRVRRRKKPLKIPEILPYNPPYKPPNCEAKPLVHIKFEAGQKPVETVNENGDGLPVIPNDGLEHSAVGNRTFDVLPEQHKEMEVIENGAASCSAPPLFSGPIPNHVVSNCPLMTDLKPCENDVIIFKVLKLGESYQPELSTNIAGRVMSHDKTTNDIVFHIMDGKDQFIQPEGKFSLLDEETENVDDNCVQCLNWMDLIEPRLLYP